MADQGVVPIGNIQGAVTSNLDIARSEIRVGRYNDRFDFGRRDIRAVVGDLVLQDTERNPMALQMRKLPFRSGGKWLLSRMPMAGTGRTRF